jgi:hypothetical protein
VVLSMAAVPVLRCEVVSDEVVGWGAFDVLTVPATQAPWGPLTPNNPLTSHLDGEKRVGMAMVGVATERAGMATVMVGVERVTAGVAMATVMVGVERVTAGMAMATVGNG